MLSGQKTAKRAITTHSLLYPLPLNGITHLIFAMETGLARSLGAVIVPMILLTIKILISGFIPGIDSELPALAKR